MKLLKHTGLSAIISVAITGIVALVVDAPAYMDGMSDLAKLACFLIAVLAIFFISLAAMFFHERIENMKGRKEPDSSSGTPKLLAGTRAGEEKREGILDLLKRLVVVSIESFRHRFLRGSTTKDRFNPSKERIEEANVIYRQLTSDKHSVPIKVDFDRYAEIAVLLSQRARLFLFWTLFGTPLEVNPQHDSYITSYEEGFEKIATPESGKVRLIVFRKEEEGKVYSRYRKLARADDTLTRRNYDEYTVRMIRRVNAVEAEFHNPAKQRYLYFTDIDKLVSRYPITKDFEFGFVEPEEKTLIGSDDEVSRAFIFQSPFSSSDQAKKISEGIFSAHLAADMNGDFRKKLALDIRDKHSELEHDDVIIPPERLEAFYLGNE